MNKKYRKLFSKIGFWYGIVGAVIFISLVLFGMKENSISNISLPEIISIPFSIILVPFVLFSLISVSNGVLGCNFKIENCNNEYILGSIIAGLVVWIVFYLIGLVIDKSKN